MHLLHTKPYVKLLCLSCAINRGKHPADPVIFRVHKVCMTNVSHNCNWGWLACWGALFWVFTGKKHLRDIKGWMPFHSGTRSKCVCVLLCVSVWGCFLIGFGPCLHVLVCLDWFYCVCMYLHNHLPTMDLIVKGRHYQHFPHVNIPVCPPADK